MKISWRKSKTMLMQIFLGGRNDVLWYCASRDIYHGSARIPRLTVSVPDWAHAPVIHVASHFYHEKRVAWVSIFMHACDPVPIVMGLRSVAQRAAGAPLLILFYLKYRQSISSVSSILCDSTLYQGYIINLIWYLNLFTTTRNKWVRHLWFRGFKNSWNNWKKLMHPCTQV